MRIEITDKNPEKSYIMIPIPRASTKEDPAGIEICTDDLPQDVYKEVILQGLKTLLNRGLTGAGKPAKGDVQALMAIVQENASKLYSGKVRLSAGMRSKASGAVKTEAMRLARVIIKEALKAAGKKISSFKASEISKAATALLASPNGAPVLKQAEENLKKTTEAEQNAQAGLGAILGEISEDPTLVAKNEERASERKKPKADKATVAAAAKASKGAGAHLSGQR